MGVSFMLYTTDTEGRHEPVESERFEIHWSYSSWNGFSAGVLNALKDAYVSATKVRNDARQAWERSDEDHRTSAPFGTSNLNDHLINEFEDAANHVKHLADLKTYWSKGENPDAVDAVWEFNKAKMIECLFEALVTDSATMDPFVERERIAWVLRYLTLNDGDHVVLA
tara:strand:- start:6754 stop:7257 length:504 start_codon:yes stop_codon:yes gene_type:complete